MRKLARESVSIFQAVLGKPWTQDDLTYDEARVISELTSMNLRHEVLGADLNKTPALHVIDMPFLDTVQDSDILALHS